MDLPGGGDDDEWVSQINYHQKRTQPAAEIQRENEAAEEAAETKIGNVFEQLETLRTAERERRILRRKEKMVKEK